MRGAQRSNDPVEHGVRPKKDVIVPEAQHPVAVIAEEFGPPGVVLRLFEMLATVQLNDQVILQADEIHQVRPDPVLSAEFPAEKTTATQVLPKPQFDLRLIPAQRLLSGMILPTTHKGSSLRLHVSLAS